MLRLKFCLRKIRGSNTLKHSSISSCEKRTSAFKKFLATESPLKVIKNTFYLTLKSLFVLKIFKFLCDLLVMKRNSRIITIRLILKYMTSERGKQPIGIQTLPNTSRSKSNQTMAFGQFIEYNMRNIFLKKLYTKFVGETIPRRFSKKLKISISLDQ